MVYSRCQRVVLTAVFKESSGTFFNGKLILYHTHFPKL